MAVIPELQFTVAGLWNGPADQAVYITLCTFVCLLCGQRIPDLFGAVLDKFVPALVAEITQYQPSLPQPPSQATFVGTYLYDIGTEIQCIIFILRCIYCIETVMVISVLQGALVANTPVGLVWLNYLGNDVFSLYTLQSAVPCMETELMAVYGQYGTSCTSSYCLQFTPKGYFNTTGGVSATLPGWAPGITLTLATSHIETNPKFISMRKLRRF